MVCGVQIQKEHLTTCRASKGLKIGVLRFFRVVRGGKIEEVRGWVASQKYFFLFFYRFNKLTFVKTFIYVQNIEKL